MTDTTAETPIQGIRERQKADTRKAIMASANKLFHIHGYEGIGMREIAKDIGVSTGAINAHFKGKDDLYQQSMGHRPVSSDTGIAAIIALTAYLVKDAYGGLTQQDIAQFKHQAQSLIGQVELCIPEFSEPIILMPYDKVRMEIMPRNIPAET